MKMNFKIIVLASLFVGSMAFAATDVKIGVVNLQEAIQKTTAGKDAKKKLEAAVGQKKGEIQKREAELKKKGEEMEKKKSLLSESVLRQQQGEFQQEMLQFRDIVAKGQMELQQKERELLEPVMKKMETVITTLAKSGKYTVILERSQNNVLWASDTVDITDEVIKAYEKAK